LITLIIFDEERKLWGFSLGYIALNIVSVHVNTYERVEVRILSFLTSALQWVECLASLSDHFTLGKHNIHWI
jgi:hypothetical protein